jgi:hypothetical protein
MARNGAKTARKWGSYDDAMLTRRGTELQNDARDAIGARETDGRKRFPRGCHGELRAKFARIPSVGAAERVFAREPPLGSS